MEDSTETGEKNTAPFALLSTEISKFSVGSNVFKTWVRYMSLCNHDKFMETSTAPYYDKNKEIEGKRGDGSFCPRAQYKQQFGFMLSYQTPAAETFDKIRNDSPPLTHMFYVPLKTTAML